MSEQYTPDGAGDAESGTHFCSMPEMPMVEMPAGLSSARLESIIETAKKWSNGTRIQYYFFDDPQRDGENVLFTDGSRRWVTWVGDAAHQQIVRDAFTQWKALGIGLEFVETQDRNEAEVRIGFMRGNGSWSYLGTDVLGFGPGERTMNFGWDMRNDPSTALHEIGHTLGLPHEHQNPFSGIVWNEEAVYAALARAPNGWSRQKTHWNIIRKLNQSEVFGSTWDPDSIMHYPFERGLILAPPPFDNQPLRPAGGLSAKDQTWMKTFYPPIAASDWRVLRVAESQRLGLANGEQANFLVEPPSTRRYTIRTAGACDTQITMFEEVNNAWRYFDFDDDSGTDENARLRVRLRRERRYAVRVRMRYDDTTSEPTIMMS